MTLNWQPSSQGTSFVDHLYTYLYTLELGPTDDPTELTTVNGNPTIGIGFDLVADGKDVRDAVMMAIGLMPDAVQARLNFPPAPGTPAAVEFNYVQKLRADIAKKSIDKLNSDMAERQQRTNADPVYAKYIADANGQTPGSFAFSSVDSVKATFDLSVKNITNQKY